MPCCGVTIHSRTENRLDCTRAYCNTKTTIARLQGLSIWFRYMHYFSKLCKAELWHEACCQGISSETRGICCVHVLGCLSAEIGYTCAGSEAIVQGQKNVVKWGAFGGEWIEKKTLTYIWPGGCLWAVVPARCPTCVTVLLVYFLSGIMTVSPWGWWNIN